VTKLGERVISVWHARISRTCLWVFRAAIALALLIVGTAIATRFDLIEKLSGFRWLMHFNIAAITLAVLSLIITVWALIQRLSASWVSKSVIAFVAALSYVIFVDRWLAPISLFPLLHDVSTDLSDPPVFIKLPLRPDNLAGLKDAAEWRARHAIGYPDIQPQLLQKSVAQTLVEAADIMRAKGWEIGTIDHATGHLEATVSTSFLRFYDDIVLRARSTSNPNITQLDMRSFSRVGISDLGLNAQRIRELQSQLAKRQQR
jgi:uncharacterized protein (DUF1499 family)